MKLRKLGTQGLAVSELGLGCIGMSDFYSEEDLRRIDEIAPQGVAAGTRYPEHNMKTVNR